MCATAKSNGENEKKRKEKNERKEANWTDTKRGGLCATMQATRRKTYLNFYKCHLTQKLRHKTHLFASQSVQQ
jgi:hypothetical protein